MATRQARKYAKRTNDILKAMRELEKFKQRITAIQDELEKSEYSVDKTCEEILLIGVKIQKVSSIVRPHSVEGMAKKRVSTLKAKFQRQITKNKDDVNWIEKNCKLPGPRYYNSYRMMIEAVLPTSSPKPKSLDNATYKRWGGIMVVPTKLWLEENDIKDD